MAQQPLEMRRDRRKRLAEHHRRQQKALNPVEENKAAQPVEEDKASDWPLKMDPEEYLKRYPDGPKADLAREIVG